jgi:hypothetical protein
MVLGALLLFGSFITGNAQKNPHQEARAAPTVPPPTLLTRNATRHETHRLGYGGTLTVVGAPQGSIIIEGWTKSEIEVTAEIQWQAETEADLNLLAMVNNFAFDEDVNHFSVLTTGSHDRAFLRRVARNFPKRLLGLPWKIDYRIRVPVATDLEINGGRGPITLSGVEGALGLSATESDATLTLTGGVVSATIGAGKVNLSIPARSWRGSGAEIRLAAGELTVELPPGFNGDIDADILRSGQIENSYQGLEPRLRPGLTARTIKGRAGTGGASFTFTVGDGTLRIRKAEQKEE